MLNTKTKVSVAVMAGLLSITAALPAQAQSFNQRQRVIETYCDRNPNDRDCRGYYGGKWGNNDYDRFYNSRRSNMDAIAAGLFGLTFGAILGSALSNSNTNAGYGDRVVGRVGGDDHVAACSARYRSYDVRTDTFTGYDGRQHECNL